MPKQRIFISHSRKGDASRKPLEAVADALDRAGFDAEYDATFVETGAEWYQRIELEMARCHGAVLLLDAATQDSEYVRHEASILAWRRRTEAGRFRLLVALVDPDPAKNEEMRAGKLAPDLKVTRLQDLQVWTAPPEHLGKNDHGPLARLIAQEACKVFGPSQRAETPLDHATEEIRKFLAVLDPAELDDKIERIAESIGDAGFVDVYAKTSVRMRAWFAARWLAAGVRSDPVPVADALGQLEWDIRKLEASGHRKVLFQAFDILHAQWVEEGRPGCPFIRRLRSYRQPEGDAPTPAAGEKILALNACYTDAFTLNRFPLHCVWPPSASRTLLCDAGAVSESAVVAVIARGLGITQGRGSLAERVSRETRRRVVICLLPRDFPSNAAEHQILASLRTALPGVVFAAWSGTGEAPEGLQDAEVEVLAPPLDPTVEEDQYLAWETLIRLFEQPTDGPHR